MPPGAMLGGQLFCLGKNVFLIRVLFHFIASFQLLDDSLRQLCDGWALAQGHDRQPGTETGLESNDQFNSHEGIQTHIIN